MKIVIGRRPAYAMEGAGYPSAPAYPHEIRAFLRVQLRRPKEDQEKLIFYTLDRTVLDEVCEFGLLSYEDVSVQRSDGTEVPLLSLHPAAFLGHFSLGDVYSRESEAWLGL